MGSSLNVLERRLAAISGFGKRYRERYPYETYALAVARLRAEHDLTQEQFGERVGLTQAQVSRLESGEHKPNIGHLEKIAAGFGLMGSFRFCHTDEDADAASQLTKRDALLFERTSLVWGSGPPLEGGLQPSPARDPYRVPPVHDHRPLQLLTSIQALEERTRTST